MELDLLPIELAGVKKERPVVIAGPCSAETEEQVMNTAHALANNGIKIFRAVGNHVPNRVALRAMARRLCLGCSE